jgi:hypothetical protein
LLENLGLCIDVLLDDLGLLGGQVSKGVGFGEVLQQLGEEEALLPESQPVHIAEVAEASVEGLERGKLPAEFGADGDDEVVSQPCLLEDGGEDSIEGVVSYGPDIFLAGDFQDVDQEEPDEEADQPAEAFVVALAAHAVVEELLVVSLRQDEGGVLFGEELAVAGQPVFDLEQVA